MKSAFNLTFQYGNRTLSERDPHCCM